MIYDGSKNVTTAGSRVPLTAASTKAAWVQIRSKGTNGANIYIGGSTVSSSSGVFIGPGEAMTLPAVADLNFLDLSTIYIDADTSGEGVVFTYARR